MNWSPHTRDFSRELGDFKRTINEGSGDEKMRSKPKFKKGKSVCFKKWDVLKGEGFKLFEDAIVKENPQLDYLSYEVYRKKLGQEYVVVDVKFSKLYHEFCYTLKFPIDFVGNEVLINNKIPESLLELCEEDREETTQLSANRDDMSLIEEVTAILAGESAEKSRNDKLFALAEEMQEFLLKLKQEDINLAIEDNKMVLSNGKLEIKILTLGLKQKEEER